MILVPYRLDASLQRIPLLTIAVCVICTVVFVFQCVSQSAFTSKLGNFCATGIDFRQRHIVQHIVDADVRGDCEHVFLALRHSPQPDGLIAKLAPEVFHLDYFPDPGQDLAYKRERLRAGFDAFQQAVPYPLTDAIEYRPGTYEPLRMITSTFAHASWDHLIGNLFFFFAFACGLECVLGRTGFVLNFILIAVVSAVAYSRSDLAAGGTPTIGLSGVAMGMMAMTAVLLPTARIRFVFLSLYGFREFGVPTLRVVGLCIAWNVFDMWFHAGSNINYVAHFGGAATGVVMGLVYRKFVPGRVAAIDIADDAQ